MTADVSNLVNLVHLSCQVTRAMQRLPDSISCLQMLTYLDVRGGWDFTDVGEGLPTLGKLAKLSLYLGNNSQLSDNLQVTHQLHIGSCVRKRRHSKPYPPKRVRLMFARATCLKSATREGGTRLLHQRDHTYWILPMPSLPMMVLHTGWL